MSLSSSHTFMKTLIHDSSSMILEDPLGRNGDSAKKLPCSKRGCDNTTSNLHQTATSHPFHIAPIPRCNRFAAGQAHGISQPAMHGVTCLVWATPSFLRNTTRKNSPISSERAPCFKTRAYKREAPVASF